MSIVHDFRVDQTPPQAEFKWALVYLCHPSGYYYGPNWAGYTDFKSKAGLYLREAAELHVVQTPGATIKEIT